MKYELKKIDHTLASAILGCDKYNDERVTQLISSCEDKLLSVITPKFTYRIFAVELTENSVKVKGTHVSIQSKDLLAHLADCDKAVIMCATIGIGADRLISRFESEDMTKGIITDALASAAAETLCDEAEKIIASKVDAENRTWRYSPGYGDFPLKHQKDIIALLNAEKELGLTLTDSMMLLPRKSVTAVIGLSDKILERKRLGCTACSFSENCTYRKAGGHCGF